jgi:uncharacterized RDD family membrane protein YckC
VAQCEAVKVHLSPIVRSSEVPIIIESDFDIPAGADVDEYKRRLFRADIVLAFISADFINDNDTYKRSQRVIERHNQNETVLFPILVRNCMWKSSPFVNLSLLPKNLQPLNNKNYWNSEDDALVAVVTDIYDAIQDFIVLENALPDDPGSTEEMSNDQASKASALGGAPSKINTEWRANYYRKSLIKRTAAILIDAVVTLPIFAIITMITSTLGLWLGRLDKDEYGKDFDSSLYYGVPLLVLIIFFAILESSKYRGTPGKIWMKLQTTDGSGKDISFYRGLWRNLLRMALGNLWLMAIVDLYIHKVDPLIHHAENISTSGSGVWSFEFYHYFIVSMPFILAQIIHFFVTNSMIHDRLAGTVVGEKV